MVRTGILIFCLLAGYLKPAAAQSLSTGGAVSDSSFAGIAAEDMLADIKKRGYHVKQLYAIDEALNEMRIDHRVALVTLDYTMGGSKVGYFMVMQELEQWADGRVRMKLMDPANPKGAVIRKYDPDLHFLFSIYP